MVKIPELPGSYRPGDVVNGHVLTPRGHWVSLDEAAARGVRPRRWLSSQVSTIRDPSSPSRLLDRATAMKYTARELERAEAYQRQAVARRAASSSASPRTAAPQTAQSQTAQTRTAQPTAAPQTTASTQVPAPPPAQPYRTEVTPPPPAQAYRPQVAPPPPPQAGNAPNPRVAAPPRPLPRVGATPSASGPVRGGATSPGPATTTRKKSGLGRLVWFFIIAFVIYRVVVASIDTAGDAFPDLGDIDDFPSAFELPEDPEVEVVNEEMWQSGEGTFFLYDVTTTEPLDHTVSISGSVEAFDADDELVGTGWVSASVAPGSRARIVGYIVPEDAEVGTLDTEYLVHDFQAYRSASEGSLRVVDSTVVPGSSSLSIEVVVEAQDEEVSMGVVTVVVRDEDGVPVAGSSGYVWEVPVGGTETTVVQIWELVSVPPGSTVEIQANGS